MKKRISNMCLLALLILAQPAGLAQFQGPNDFEQTPSQDENSPQGSDNVGGAGNAQGAAPGGMGGRFRNGSRWQSLSPEQKKQIIQRVRARRQAGATGMNSQAAPANLDNVAIQNDVAYGADPLQRLDVYSPKNKSANQALPICIFVHGGGWSRGDKNQGDRKTKGCAYVAENIVFVSTNYRLAPNVMHPKQVQDIAQAIAWVKKHAPEFGGDPNKIFIMGHSAGAHLVDLVATNDKYLTEAGLSLKDIKGVISLDTASLNLTTRRNDDGPETGLVGPMIDTAFGKDPAVLKDGSPTLSIKPGKTYPPFLMFCGSRRTNCVQQHRDFEAAMHKVGGQVTVTPVPLSHADVNRASGQPGTEVYKGCMQMIKG
ncbi:MAG TPA: alpha/beta hydrolase [Drouetiella sp.]